MDMNLFAPSSELGLPAPFWFIMIFKVLGFILHLVPMSLWFTGILLAMIMRWLGKSHALDFSNRLMKQMPVIIAYGINLGIIPLLFIQVVYYKVFYPATILMAWPWFMVVIFLIFSYYGTYIYVIGLKKEEQGGRMTTVQKTMGWVSAILFIIIGFIFSNALTMMTNLKDWETIWQATNFGGAVNGTALNTGDPTLWPRWLMVMGLALTVTAIYILIDAVFFARKFSAEFKKWMTRLSFNIYSIGLIIFAAMGSWYVFTTWPEPVSEIMLKPPYLYITILTAITPGIVWLLLLLQRNKIRTTLATLAGLGQFLVIALNAISRQMVQNIELFQYFNPADEQLKIQWSPLILFLVLFVGGLLIIFWMIRKVMEAQSQRVEEQVV